MAGPWSLRSPSPPAQPPWWPWNPHLGIAPRVTLKACAQGFTAPGAAHGTSVERPDLDLGAAANGDSWWTRWPGDFDHLQWWNLIFDLLVVCACFKILQVSWCTKILQEWNLPLIYLFAGDIFKILQVSLGIHQTPEPATRRAQYLKRIIQPQVCDKLLYLLVRPWSYQSGGFDPCLLLIFGVLQHLNQRRTIQFHASSQWMSVRTLSITTVGSRLGHSTNITTLVIRIVLRKTTRCMWNV